MSAADPYALVEILKSLGRHWRDLHDRLDKKKDRGIEVTEAEDELYFNHPLDYATEQIEKWTGEDRQRVKEAAWRLNTAFGLSRLEKHTPRVKVEPDAEDFLEPTPRPDLEDLTDILPKLKDLDRDGNTALLLKSLWGQFPDTCKETGLPKPERTRDNNNPPADDLQPCQRKVYQSYKYAEVKMGDIGDPPKTDRAAYDWLKENGLEDYELPSFETWSRQVRAGRKAERDNKNTPRGGRTGRSVIGASEIHDARKIKAD